MIRTFMDFNLVFNAYLPSVVLFVAFVYSLYFAWFRKQYLVTVLSAIFFLGGLHQLAEVRTWLETGRVPSPDWYLGDFSETMVYLLSVVGFLLYVYYYEWSQELLEEKDRLLDEVNHRIKNNLQMIESLLSYRIDKIEEAGIKEQFREVMEKLKSFSLLYDKLQKSKSFDEVDIREYLEDLCTTFDGQYSRARRLTIRTNIDTVQISFDRAVAFGLIVTELVTNSIQHSDPVEPNLLIEVAFYSNHEYTLEVRDNGRDFDPSISDDDQEGGFSLIEQITEYDLSGSFELAEENGMLATVKVPR